MHFIIYANCYTNVNVKKKCDYRSILLAACEGGQLQMVQYLHKQGFDIHTTHPDNGKTSLMQAAYSGNLELVKWLVHQKVEVNKVDKDGESALHVTAHRGHIPVMEYMLHLGANTDIVAKQG